eukprot:Skav234116  [mRNA]  locus=scaffold4487:145867:148299:- [translate_table: standard]
MCPQPRVSNNFLHCSCGIDCQKDMGKEHGFQLLQGCSCRCNLRGAAAPVEGTAEDFVALLAEQDRDWDASAGVLPLRLLGELLQKLRRTIEDPIRACPCGTVCLKRLQWFGGVGWCIRRQCIPCP